MAMKLTPSPLRVTLTQGGADAFVQASFATGLQSSSNNIFKLAGIAWELTGNPFDVNNANIEFSLTRRTKAAVPLLTDIDVLFKHGWATKTAGAAYSWHLNRVGVVLLPVALPIVEDTLYAQLDSAATALTNVVNLALLIEDETMSQLDRLQLVARSIT